MPLFEVFINNRVIKKTFSKNKRIRGKQGQWYAEQLYYLADSEEEAREFAMKQIEKRRIIGIPNNTRRKLRREIQIIDVRRLA